MGQLRIGSRWRIFLLVAALAPAACKDKPAAPDSGVPDLQGPRPEGVRPDAAGPTIPPLAPQRDPEPLPVKEWMVAGFAPTATDTVRTYVEQGTFDLPAKGKAYGTDWGPTAPGPSGELSTVIPQSYSIYAAARIEAPAGKRVFGRYDSVYTVHVDGAVQPGDIYGRGWAHCPTMWTPGSHLVVVSGEYYYSRPQVELWSTGDELVFKSSLKDGVWAIADATVPDLVVGDSTEQWLGVGVLNLAGKPVYDVTARVEDDSRFAGTETKLPALAVGATTMVPFRLAPKQSIAGPPQKMRVGLRLESASLSFSYRRELELEVVAAGTTFRRTFRSPSDGSVQYYGVVPPKDFDAAKSYALVLSLHGASVEAIGQAKAYSQKDWAYIVAPTNRRPFGFDWEEFGRVNALEVLDHATASFKIAPDRVYLTGHSMGGHGTYHVGVHFPGRFAAIAPSAGWSSFESYSGEPRPTGAVGRARAASNTLDYVGNLARRGAYVLQGELDDNVPKSEALMMVAALKKVTNDVVYFEQPGAGHWWDGDAAPGADCVDWPALFDFLKAHTLDPTELDFTFTSASPWISGKHSYVTIQSETDAYKDCVVESKAAGDTVTLTTTNVRSLSLDGAALKARNVSKVIVDGKELAVTGAALTVGPQTGKRPGLHGPLNQAFHRPFCFVYPDGSTPFERYAAHLTSQWAVLGNGLACALPLSKVKPELRASHDLVYIGVPSAQLPVPAGLAWDASSLTVGTKSYQSSALAVVFPEGERLSAVFTATTGSEYLLFRFTPFSSRNGRPDYWVWSASGSVTSGFFTPDWTYAAGR